ncbi:M14 family zinc carboxypeptidase [Salipaludibacillus aurantiacus]|uniref:Zinc carboxypeptidase n=1 Tax=Salipaludibacillus aurantiacus TaxID=1601833 RepID=A0A1H9QG38_9BACI|nr:M14 family zinc carboxypeptidase [Salipaludibacillus aurantiacus]SER58733.1 Zinc carboxypeptidase [Salipaludibacillus aurantiacus]
MALRYELEGSLAYEPYSEVEARLSRFKDVSVIGEDSSGKYNMYLVEMGNKTKPVIFLSASLHGTEWQAAQYTLRFMEQLRDDTFPDKEFRDKLLTDFHIAYLPVGNPWGYDEAEPYSELKGRKNANGVDVNRDFHDFSQVESQNIQKAVEKLKPFAYLDCHLMAAREDEGQSQPDLVVGNMHDSNLHVRDFIADSLSSYTSQSVGTWDSSTNEARKGLSRRYMSATENPYTPETLSIISEMYRPVDFGDGVVQILSDEEIMKAGMATVYFFFKAASDYFYTHNPS